MRDHTKLRAFESTGGSFPAAFLEFVIPAEAGIQMTRLDSPVSSTGQAPYQVRGRRVKHGMTGQNRRRYPAACCGVVHLADEVRLDSVHA